MSTWEKEFCSVTPWYWSVKISRGLVKFGIVWSHFWGQTNITISWHLGSYFGIALGVITSLVFKITLCPHNSVSWGIHGGWAVVNDISLMWHNNRVGSLELKLSHNPRHQCYNMITWGIYCQPTCDLFNRFVISWCMFLKNNWLRESHWWNLAIRRPGNWRTCEMCHFCSGYQVDVESNEKALVICQLV